MITFYTASGQHFSSDIIEEWPRDALWVDMLNPTEDQIRKVENFFEITLPHQDELSDIQISSQLYSEGDSHIIVTPIIAGAGRMEYEVGAMGFTLSPRVLATLRTQDPRAILLFRDKFMLKPSEYDTPSKILLGMLDVFVDRSADVLERIGDQVDALSRQIFNGREQKGDLKMDKDSHMRHILQSVGQTGDLLGQLRNAMAGSERGVIFLSNHADNILGTKGVSHIKTIQRDVHALELQADSLQQRIVFLLDAALGIITIEQNNVVRIFTVAATTLMPPTLIASVYGMNFHNMPELNWNFGYPMAIMAMLASALIPLLYFRHKGWI